MSLKREMLVDAGIEDKDTIERIMAAYGYKQKTTA